MNRTNETRLPGDTLETLIQEFEYLEEFKRYLRERQVFIGDIRSPQPYLTEN